MSDGIRINDASLEISPDALDALIKKQGASVTVTKLDLSVSPAALTTLLRGLAPEGAAAPAVEMSDGRLQVTAERDGKPMGLDLQVGGLRVEITGEGLRLVSG
jgi:hypothetical protein